MRLSPYTDGAVSFTQAIIASNVDSRRDFARRRLRCVHLSGGFKAACHFDPEIHVHRRVPMGRMVIQENIVPILSAKSRLATQESPNLIQGGPPGHPDGPDRNLASDGGQFPR